MYWDNLSTRLVLFLPPLACGVVVFLLFWLAALSLQKLVERLLWGRLIDAEIVNFLGRGVKFGVLAFGAVTALGTMGLNVSALVAGLGLTGLAIGLAMKDLISNLVAGILVILYKPIRRGDAIAVASFQGTVAEINLRYTVLHSEAATIYVPNQTMFSSGITVEQRAAETPTESTPPQTPEGQTGEGAKKEGDG